MLIERRSGDHYPLLEAIPALERACGMDLLLVKLILYVRDAEPHRSGS
jgi:hypothetical protein